MASKIGEMFVELGLKKDKFDKGIDSAKGTPSVLQGAFKTLGPAIAAAFSTAAIMSFMKASTDAYNQQARAEAGLLTALKGRKEVQSALLDQANALQQTTLFEDDTIVQAQKLLATMGLAATQIHDLLPSLADFSEATGTDLVQAANLAGKAIGTGTNALGRYGVELDSTMSKTEKANAIMAVFTERYGGQAQQAAKVGMSGLQQLNKAWGEIQEMVGTRVGPFINAIATLMSKKLFDVSSGDPNENAINEYLEATADKRDEILKGYESTYKEYKRLADKYKEVGTGEGSKYEYYQSESDKVSEFIGKLKDLNKEANVVFDEIDTTTLKEKLPDATISANAELMKYIDSLNIAKFSLDEFLKSSQAVAEHEATVNYKKTLPGQDDEENVADEIDTEKIFKQYKLIKDRSKEFVNEMNDMLQGMTSNFITGFSDGIADLMTGDIGLDGFFNRILESIGGFLQQIGASLIAYGVAIDAFKKAFTNPWVAIAAGAALVVLGGVISNMASKGPQGSTFGMAGGGGGGGPMDYNTPGSEYGSGPIQLSARVSGEDLLFVMERAGRNSSRGGRL